MSKFIDFLNTAEGKITNPKLNEMLIIKKGPMTPAAPPKMDPFAAGLAQFLGKVAPGMSDACATTGEQPEGRDIAPVGPSVPAANSELPGSANLKVQPGQVGIAKEPGKGYRITFADIDIIIPEPAAMALRSFMDVNCGAETNAIGGGERNISCKGKATTVPNASPAKSDFASCQSSGSDEEDETPCGEDNGNDEGEENAEGSESEDTPEDFSEDENSESDENEAPADDDTEEDDKPGEDKPKNPFARFGK